MKEKKKIAYNLLGAGFLVFCLLIWGAYVKVEAAQNKAPGDSLVTPELEQQIDNYVAGSASPSVFKDRVQEVLPFQTSPYNKFNLAIGGKQSYQNGEKFEVQGTLSFSSQAQAEAQKFLKDCQSKSKSGSQCLNPPSYSFPTLDNVGVFVQVWKKDKTEMAASKGDFLVDEFYALQGATLKENESKEFTINWQVPGELKEGDYYLALYVNSGKGFDLWGSPLVPYSWAKVFDFGVKTSDGVIGSGIELDKDNIRVNGKSYSYRQPAPEVTPNDSNEIAVELPLTNLNPQKENIKLKYELYRFGQSDPENLINSEEETKTVNAGEKTALQYSFSPNATDSLYNVKVIASTAKSISESNIRFVVTGKDRGIFRFLGLAQSQGSFNPLICLRDAVWNGLFPGKVKISVADNHGNLLGDFEQDANIKAETRCFVLPSIKFDKPNCGVIMGEIQDKQGVVVDKKTVAVSCEAPPGGVSSTLENLGQALPFKGGKGWIVLFVIVAFAIGGGILYLNNKRKNDEK